MSRCLVGGLGRGTLAGALYLGIGALALLVADGRPEGEDGFPPLQAYVLVAYFGVLLGALTGALPGLIGGAALWSAARWGLSGRRLLGVGALLGAVLGWSSVSAWALLGTAPDVDSTGTTLFLRLGPAVAGAASAVWQAARTTRPLQATAAVR